MMAVLVVFVAVICLFALLVLRGIPMRPTKNNTTRTVVSMLGILHHFDADDSMQKSNLLMDTTLDSLTINRKMSAFLENKRSSFEPVNISSNGMMLDGWGKPLLFALTNTAIYEQLNPLMKEKVPRRPFIVWSAGVNGTNDLGFGDDAILR